MEGRKRESVNCCRVDSFDNKTFQGKFEFIDLPLSPFHCSLRISSLSATNHTYLTHYYVVVVWSMIVWSVHEKNNQYSLLTTVSFSSDEPFPFLSVISWISILDFDFQTKILRTGSIPDDLSFPNFIIFKINVIRSGCQLHMFLLHSSISFTEPQLGIK